MTAFIEIENSGVQDFAVETLSNGSGVIVLDDTSLFPPSGYIVFKDTNSEMQKLTYTANNTSTNRLTVTASTWSGTGDIANLTIVYEDSYKAVGNTSFTERIIAD